MKYSFMGIFDDLHNRYGRRKDKVVQELLGIIKRMETEAILAQREAVLAEKNESKLIESSINKDWQIIDLNKKLDQCEKKLDHCQDKLENCKKKCKPNPVKLIYSFI